MAFSTGSSITQEAVNLSPPCSTRWPTAPISPMEVMTPWAGSISASSTSCIASVWLFIGCSTTYF